MIDIVEPFKPTSKKTTSILDISDLFTRWKDVLLLQDRAAWIIADLLEEYLVI